MDRVIYQQFHGIMAKVEEPLRPNNTNFLITWKGMDWSGFRTLVDCERQFPELENKSGDNYQVVER